ncbi:MAG: hypothetical protein PHU21_11105, partial [Elusimicrobia bacterium]|nr:hypothetical protein [Elusimicrobiota bacterium]
MKRALLLMTLLAGAWCAAPARAATFRPQGTASPGSVPGGINYQGQLQDNGIPVTAKWGFVFRLYDAKENGNLIATFPPEPDNMQVDIISGLFSVNIPVTTNTLVGGGQRWLEVEVDREGVAGGAGQKMTPREQLYSMPYALVAKTIEGTIDISTGGLVITTTPVSNAAFYISSGTAFIGIGTAHPASLLHMSSGTLTIDGDDGQGHRAGFHLSSGPMAVDGSNARLDVLGPAWFGLAGTQSSFDALGALHLTSPLSLQYGGTGTDLGSAGLGAIPYFSAPGVMSYFNVGTNGALLRSDGTNPAWTSASYPGTVAQGDLLYGSALDTVSRLSVAASSRILTSNGVVPVWTSAQYPSVVFKGDLLYASANDVVSTMSIVAAGRLLRSNGTVPVWTSASYPGTVAQGDLLYGSVADTVSRLTWVGTATRYLANTGAGIPKWDQVNLSNGVQNKLGIVNGGTGSDLSLGGASAQGSIPYFSNTNVMTTLGPDAGGALAGWVLATKGTGNNPYWRDLASGATIYTARNLIGGSQGAVPYQSAPDTTQMLAPGTAAGQLLQTGGAGANPAWTTAAYPNTTVINQILYSAANNSVAGLATLADGVLVTDGSGKPEIGTDLPTGVTIGTKYIYRAGGTDVPFADGGTGADLSGLDNGSFIYKIGGSLAGSALNGVLKGNGSGAPTAMQGVTDHNAYWSDANTIGAVQFIAISSGGTGADLSGVAAGGLIYKAANSLAGTADLNGVLRMNGAGAPTAMTGTQDYIAYWSDANTISGVASVAISSGGTGADLTSVPEGGLIYKAADKLAGTSALNGILQGSGSGTPVALQGIQFYNVYWSDANTIAARQFTPLDYGG